jgi:uncharacterized protein
MAALTGGRSAVKQLLSRVVLWRVGVRWYVIALGLPTVLALAAAGLYYVVGGSTLVQMGAVSVLDFVVFVLVVGEELGWRGYALPLLLEKRSAVVASLILGVVWGLWHLPTFLVPGTPQYGLPLPAFVLLTVEYSILMTWVFLHTKGSVLLATLFHGAINLSQGLFLGGLEGAERYWLLCIVYGVAALVVAVFALGLKSLRSLRAEAKRRPKPATFDGLLLDQLSRAADFLLDLRIPAVGQRSADAARPVRARNLARHGASSETPTGARKMPIDRHIAAEASVPSHMPRASSSEIESSIPM